MIFTNQMLIAKKKKKPFGDIYQVGMGQFGRERKFMALTCPEGTRLNVGLNPEFTIGETWSGKPRIIKKLDETIYLLLSSEGELDDGVFGYDGAIMVLEGQKKLFQVMAYGNGLGGNREDPFYWDCMLLKAPSDVTSLVKIHPSGSDHEVLSTVFLIYDGYVYESNIDSIEEICEKLGINVPCEIVEEDGVRYFGDDWIQL